jgi:hypothetical protein
MKLNLLDGNAVALLIVSAAELGQKPLNRRCNLWSLKTTAGRERGEQLVFLGVEVGVKP